MRAECRGREGRINVGTQRRFCEYSQRGLAYIAESLRGGFRTDKLEPPLERPAVDSARRTAISLRPLAGGAQLFRARAYWFYDPSSASRSTDNRFKIVIIGCTDEAICAAQLAQQAGMRARRTSIRHCRFSAELQYRLPGLSGMIPKPEPLCHPRQVLKP